MDGQGETRNQGDGVTLDLDSSRRTVATDNHIQVSQDFSTGPLSKVLSSCVPLIGGPVGGTGGTGAFLSGGRRDVGGVSPQCELDDRQKAQNEQRYGQNEFEGGTTFLAPARCSTPRPTQAGH